MARYQRFDVSWGHFQHAHVQENCLPVTNFLPQRFGSGGRQDNLVLRSEALRRHDIVP